MEKKWEWIGGLFFIVVVVLGVFALGFGTGKQVVPPVDTANSVVTIAVRDSADFIAGTICRVQTASVEIPGMEPFSTVHRQCGGIPVSPPQQGAPRRQ